MTLFKRILEKFHTCSEEIRHECPVLWPAHFVALNQDMLKDIRDMEEPERKSHAAEISKIFETKAFNCEIESMVEQQVYYLAERARNETELSFGRGTINGLRIIQERFEKLYSEHKERSRPEEPFDPYELLPKA